MITIFFPIEAPGAKAIRGLLFLPRNTSIFEIHEKATRILLLYQLIDNSIKSCWAKTLKIGDCHNFVNAGDMTDKKGGAVV